ncbi:hypothetical protein B296_00020374, partial [Ensete ventricosum]
FYHLVSEQRSSTPSLLPFITLTIALAIVIVTVFHTASSHLPAIATAPSSSPALAADHHLPFSSNATSTAASLAFSCNHRWALLMLTPLPPPSPALGHRPATTANRCPATSTTPPVARLPYDSPRRTPLPPSSQRRDQRLQPAATPVAITLCSSFVQPRKPPPPLPLLPLLPTAYRCCQPPTTVASLFLPPLPVVALIAPSALLTLPVYVSSVVVSAPSNAAQPPMLSLLLHLPSRCSPASSSLPPLLPAAPAYRGCLPPQQLQPQPKPSPATAAALSFSLLCFLLPLLVVAAFLLNRSLTCHVVAPLSPAAALVVPCRSPHRCQLSLSPACRCRQSRCGQVLLHLRHMPLTRQ